MMEEDKKVQEDTTEIIIEESQDEIQEEVQEELTPAEKQEKKIKNLLSLVVLLGGLFVGSLFVDVAQMVKGGGFSQKVLNGSDVFQVDGKTWVAYSEPMVKIQVVSDDTCEACDPSEALVGLRRVMPTMMTEKIDAKSEAGKALLAKFEIKTIPALIFSKEVEKTELFTQAQQFFVLKDNAYALKTSEVGLPVGKYIEGPSVGDADVQLGAKDAKVKVVEFMDFQSPSSKKYHETITKNLIKDYADKVLIAFKQLPSGTYPQAQNSALASLCANEQGKFVAYADKLFSSQADWSSVKDVKNTQKFKTYASQLGLNAGDFNKCLDDKKFQDKISSDVNEGISFGIQGVPTTFINDQIQAPTVKYDDLKKVIDEQLAK